MLSKTPPFPSVKSVCLNLDDEPLRALLEALLREWGYRLSADPVDQPLLIIGEGLAIPSGFRHILTLCRSHYQDRKRLEIPLMIESLYLALENHFHRTPRNHIRIPLEWPIRVWVRGDEFETRTLTVADRGMRFISPLELAREEELKVRLERADETYHLTARAVYSLVGREIGREDRIEVGAVCTPQSKEVRESIRSWIIATYLERVRPALEPQLFAEALQHLNLTQLTGEIVRGERG